MRLPTVTGDNCDKCEELRREYNAAVSNNLTIRAKIIGTRLKDHERHSPDHISGLNPYVLSNDRQIQRDAVTIGSIQHSNEMCNKYVCACWCQACERHNAPPEKPDCGCTIHADRGESCGNRPRICIPCEHECWGLTTCPFCETHTVTYVIGERDGKKVPVPYFVGGKMPTAPAAPLDPCDLRCGHEGDHWAADTEPHGPDEPWYRVAAPAAPLDKLDGVQCDWDENGYCRCIANARLEERMEFKRRLISAMGREQGEDLWNSLY
jgi:hypothetical protein